MSITKLNESSLLALGMDRPTVKALTHLLKQVGSELNAETLPEVAAQAGTTAATLQSIAIDLANAIESLSLLSTLPTTEPMQPLDNLAPLSLAEPMQMQMQGDQSPVVQLVQAVEVLQTEVRQIAEQQVLLMTLINEIQQGTML